jgi:uncharacterized membrane protein (Fun14 family)
MNEERELQIKIAQLNAHLQFYLASCFGLFGGSVIFTVAGYELHTSYSLLLSIVGIVLLCLAGYYLYLISKCLAEFRNLK